MHGAFGFRYPAGWHNQLGNEPGIALAYRQRYRWVDLVSHDRRYLDLSPTLALAAGNVVTYASVGTRLRLGYSLSDDFGPPALKPVGFFSPLGHAPDRSESDVEAFAFVGGEARAYARNIFLDGNSFRDSHRVQKRPLVLELEAGASIRYRRLSLTWRYAQTTPDFEGDDRIHCIGALQLAYRWE